MYLGVLNVRLNRFFSASGAKTVVMMSSPGWALVTGRAACKLPGAEAQHFGRTNHGQQNQGQF